MVTTSTSHALGPTYLWMGYAVYTTPFCITPLCSTTLYNTPLYVTALYNTPLFDIPAYNTALSIPLEAYMFHAKTQGTD